MKIGENKLTAADRLKEFLDGIERYITAKNLSPTQFNTDFAIAETLSINDLSKLTQEECFSYAYQLYQYADCIASERADCENVIRWCENSLQSIISEMLSSGVWDTYAKHETKVATILRNDDLAHKINEWKLTAQGRLEKIKTREFNLRKKAELLTEKGKRK